MFIVILISTDRGVYILKKINMLFYTLALLSFLGAVTYPVGYLKSFNLFFSNEPSSLSKCINARIQWKYATS